jgi:hypothetical protein
MSKTDRETVLGLLLHVGGVGIAGDNLRKRVIESIQLVDQEIGLWQAMDSYIGASWIVVLSNHEIMQLCAPRLDGTCWKPYQPCTRMEIVSSEGFSGIASVASFHDNRLDVCPPCFMKIGSRFVYRNVSGNVVVLDDTVAKNLLELNDIKL